MLERSAWQLRGCLGREWEWHTGPNKAWDAPGWLPARVPGSVLDDLMRAGEVDDLYHERQLGAPDQRDGEREAQRHVHRGEPAGSRQRERPQPTG